MLLTANVDCDPGVHEINRKWHFDVLSTRELDTLPFGFTMSTTGFAVLHAARTPRPLRFDFRTSLLDPVLAWSTDGENFLSPRRPKLALAR